MVVEGALVGSQVAWAPFLALVNQLCNQGQAPFLPCMETFPPQHGPRARLPGMGSQHCPYCKTRPCLCLCHSSVKGE